MVKIKPTFIWPSVDCFKIGVQEKKYILIQAITKPSISPMHNISNFFNSFKAPYNRLYPSSSSDLKRIFSSHKIFITNDDKRLKIILIQKG